MKQRFLAVLLAALSVGAAQAANPLYAMRVTLKGLHPAPAPTPSGLVGDGVSKAGACAAGAASNCAYWGTDSTGVVLSNNNLSVELYTGFSSAAIASVSKASGKWYWELTYNATSSGTAPFVGLVADSFPKGRQWIGNYNQTYGMYVNSVGCANAWGTNTTSGPQWASTKGSTLGIAVDVDAHTLTLYHDGVLVGVACTNLPPAIKPLLGYGNASTTWIDFDANFGQANFKYPVPAGYNAGLW